MAQTSKTERKARRKWLSWKTQVVVVATVGAIAGLSRYFWWRTKRAAKPS
jgi:hypothetical protein